VLARTNGLFSAKQKWVIAELFVEFQQQPTVFSLGAQYRLASQKFMFVLSSIDTLMSSAPNSKVAWAVVSYALGLHLSSYLIRDLFAQFCQHTVDDPPNSADPHRHRYGLSRTSVWSWFKRHAQFSSIEQFADFLITESQRLLQYFQKLLVLLILVAPTV
jgi:hypothetical protein